MSENLVAMPERHDLMTTVQASHWASDFLQQSVTPSNIAYLVRYGRIRSYGSPRGIRISRADLEAYYKKTSRRESLWKQKLGEDLNWKLSFSEFKEYERTKHVHRLHPYKGKFIPQLVEYFIDAHTDNFKREQYFRAGDFILDPFCGSGTTLVECSEKNLHAVGVEISQFNTIISNSKMAKYDLSELFKAIQAITSQLKTFNAQTRIHEFEAALLEALYEFNLKHFLNADAIAAIHANGTGDAYGRTMAQEFLPTFVTLAEKFSIPLFRPDSESFFTQWFHPHIQQELELIQAAIRESPASLANILSIILCRTARSSRATTHSDLATLAEPVSHTYYCRKHGKICKPLFSAQKWWETYGQDSLKRIDQFDKLRSNSLQHCLWGDSLDMDIEARLQKEKPGLATVYARQGIQGIFSSPPYVGLIDYHEQHAYAYELLDIERADEREIGPACSGQGRIAREKYIESIAAVLVNCKRFLVPNYHVFLVANDKFNLYPSIAQRARMKIVNRYKRPVLHRTEKNRSAYAEFIFHMQEG